MPNKDPLNLGQPAKDEWARLLAPKRDVTGGPICHGVEAKRTFKKLGDHASFVYPMSIRGETTWLEGTSAQELPVAIYPPRNVSPLPLSCRVPLTVPT